MFTYLRITEMLDFPLPGYKQSSEGRVWLKKISAPRDDYPPISYIDMDNPPGMYFPCLSLSQA
jgi:hypothetical protein